jgi:rhamnose transport system permease protein
MLTFGLGLMNVPGIMMSIITGLLLIVAIAVPLVIQRIVPRRV